MPFSAVGMEKCESYDSMTMQTPPSLAERHLPAPRFADSSVSASSYPRSLFTGRALDYGQGEVTQPVAGKAAFGLLASPLPVSIEQNIKLSLPQPQDPSPALTISYVEYTVLQGERFGRHKCPSTWQLCLNGRAPEDVIAKLPETILTKRYLNGLRAEAGDLTLRQITRAELAWEEQCARLSAGCHRAENDGMPPGSSSQNSSHKRKADEMGIDDEGPQETSTTPAVENAQQGSSRFTHR